MKYNQSKKDFNMVTDIASFAEKMKEGLEQQWGSSCQIVLNPVNKNNGIILTALTILKEGSRVGFNIYLEDYFEEYQSGREIEDICQEVLERYEEYGIPEDIDSRSFFDFQAAREKICFKLVSAERNSSSLVKMPHRHYLDFAVIYYILLSTDSAGTAVVIIDDWFMTRWGVTEADLFECAQKNTPRLLRKWIMPMGAVLGMDCCSETGKIRMFVVSNTESINGASVLLYENVLKDFAQRISGDFYILPSSTNELIFLPVTEYEETEVEGLAQVVRETNQTMVRPDEILSDHVYRYFAKDGCMKIIA